MLRLVAGFELPDHGASRIDGRRVAGAGLGPARAPPRGHGVPGLRALPAPLRGRERRLRRCRAGCARASRAPRCSSSSGLGGLGARYPARAVRRPAAARRARARAGAASRGSCCSTSRGAHRPAAARADARRASAAILRAAGVDGRAGHPRPGGGVLARRPHRADGARPDRPGRHARGAVLRARRPLGGASSSAPRTSCPAAKRRVGTRVRASRPRRRRRARAAGAGRARASTSRRPAGWSGREFRGHDVFYRVHLGDGTTLCSQRPSNEVVPLGARVRVALHDGPVAVFR